MPDYYINKKFHLNNTKIIYNRFIIFNKSPNNYFYSIFFMLIISFIIVKK